MRATVLLVVVLTLVAACGRPPETSNAPDAPTPAVEAHGGKVYWGGPIYTANPEQPTAEAVITRDGRITFVGSRADAEDRMQASDFVVDLEGAAMFPGFTDAHVHLSAVGFRELTLDLADMPSLAAVVEAVAEEVEEASPGSVISGRGWIETHWPEGRFPTRGDLDPVAPDNPVILVRADGHALVANSAALAAAGVTRETQAPAGGEILRDAAGDPTGFFVDNAMPLVAKLIDAPSDDRILEAYRVGAEVYAAYGWTGGHNMSVDWADVPLMEQLAGEGRLPLRVYNAVAIEDAGALFEAGARATIDGRVTTQAIKAYIDGALGSRGAALLAPYSDAPHTRGLILRTKSETLPVYEQALRQGIQVVTHAIGDRGNRLLLNWYEAAFAMVPPEARAVAAPRWRDEHTQIVHPDDIPRFSELGVIASMQPSHAIGDLFFAPARLGDERLVGAYAWRSLIDAGAIIAGGSDAPVEKGDPMIEFYAAVARRDLKGFSAENWRAQEAMTRDEALMAFTAWPAYARFAEDDLGSIEVGKRADFSVFSEDIMTIELSAIPDVEAIMTVIDGEPAYIRPMH